MILLFCLLAGIAHAWTITFDSQACASGHATDPVSSDQAVIGRNSTCGAGGVTVVSCAWPTEGVGGPFIEDILNLNLSIEVNFTAQHPIPNMTTLFATAAPTPGPAFDVNMAYYGGMSLLMVNNYVPEDPELLDGWVASHFFSLSTPSSLSRTGHCDSTAAATQLLFFNDATFQSLMQGMRNGTGDRTYSVRAMFVQLPNEALPILYVRLRHAEQEGWAFAPTSAYFGFRELTIYGYTLANDTAFYVGCGPDIPGSSPGTTIKSVEVSQHVFVPPV